MKLLEAESAPAVMVTVDPETRHVLTALEKAPGALLLTALT